MVRQGIGVSLGLLVGFCQIFTAGLHFDENVAFPKQVDVAVPAVRVLNFVFKNRHAFTAHTQHAEEINQE